MCDKRTLTRFQPAAPGEGTTLHRRGSWAPLGRLDWVGWCKVVSQSDPTKALWQHTPFMGFGRGCGLELQEETAELKEKVRRLEEQLAVKGSLNFEKGVYYLQEDRKKSGPYCQRCYDKDAKLVRLQDDGDHWFCYGCSHGYRAGTIPHSDIAGKPAGS